MRWPVTALARLPGGRHSDSFGESSGFSTVGVPRARTRRRYHGSPSSEEFWPARGTVAWSDLSALLPHPVRVDGSLDPQLSRWLWLVKWLLAIPHFIVLFFLFIAFVVLTIVALFAILFTGRYPRSIFDFNVGVLRWAWRVGFYTYEALGTDRYPPFTLGREPDYPATLDVEYPERLSRGLVLVKWWLLAIPHYLLLGVFLGGGWFAWNAGWDEEGRGWSGGPGLIGLLVFFAAIALLFAARYPRGIFDLVVGLNRWVFRVIAYAALMTDAYPPFRLDQRGPEPSPSAPDGGEPEVT
jgi:hypothetical protein